VGFSFSVIGWALLDVVGSGVVVHERMFFLGGCVLCKCGLGFGSLVGIVSVGVVLVFAFVWGVGVVGLVFLGALVVSPVSSSWVLVVVVLSSLGLVVVWVGWLLLYFASSAVSGCVWVCVVSCSVWGSVVVVVWAASH
jgi:hypothetical protein